MKKLLLPILLLFVLMLSACGNESESTTSDHSEATDNEKERASETSNESGKVTYQSENGPIEVPANPQRVIVLSTYAGNVMSLDVPLVGVDSWSKMNPLYTEHLEGVEEVTDENLEKIIELNPDLIIGLSTMKNVDKLSKIAPVVTYTYGANDYLTQHIEIGKLLNKEEEARAWVEDFKKRSQETGENIKAKIGEDATVSVVENFDKQLYVFGDAWARGTEILYQEMGLKMPEKVKEVALEPGYFAFSLEVLPEYVGDYLIVSKNEDTDTSFLQSETYKNIPAVQNGNVFVANAKKFYFNDPITLEYQLQFFKDAFLGN